MPKTSQTMPKTESSRSAGEIAMKELEDAGLGSLNWVGLSWFETMADISSEMLSFVAERVQEDVKTQHALLHCKTPQEVQQEQARFLERAYVQYTVETGKLLNLSLEKMPFMGSQTKNAPL